MAEGFTKQSPDAVADQDGPAWDQAKADWLVNKYALVGLTYLAADGETVTSQAQFHGTITSVERGVGVTLVCAGESIGKTMVLPPGLEGYDVAGPGEYRLRTTGEVIRDPDVLTTWTITARPDA